MNLVVTERKNGTKIRETDWVVLHGSEEGNSMPVHMCMAGLKYEKLQWYRHGMKVSRPIGSFKTSWQPGKEVMACRAGWVAGTMDEDPEGARVALVSHNDKLDVRAVHIKDCEPFTRIKIPIEIWDAGSVAFLAMKYSRQVRPHALLNYTSNLIFS